MKIEDITNEAIESLLAASTEQLEQLCKQFGYTPQRRTDICYHCLPIVGETLE